MGNHALKGVEGFEGRGGEFFRVDPKVINVVGGWNHRTDFAGEEDLMASIIENGVKVPLLVKKTDDGTLNLVDGERRLRATLRAINEGSEIKSVPVQVAKRNTNDIDLYLESFIRNDSKPPTPTEEATAFKRLINWGLSVREVASKVGRSETHIRNRLELSNAIPAVKKAVDDGEITVKDAQEIAKESDGQVDTQVEALEKKKAAPNPRKKPKPITMYIKNEEVRSRGGKKGQECQPLIEFFTNSELRKRIKDAGFDPDSLQVKVTAIKEGEINEAV